MNKASDVLSLNAVLHEFCSAEGERRRKSLLLEMTTRIMIRHILMLLPKNIYMGHHNKLKINCTTL